MVWHIRSGHSRGAWYGNHHYRKDLATAWYGISDPGIPEEHGMGITIIERTLQQHGMAGLIISRLQSRLIWKDWSYPLVSTQILTKKLSKDTNTHFFKKGHAPKNLKKSKIQKTFDQRRSNYPNLDPKSTNTHFFKKGHVLKISKSQKSKIHSTNDVVSIQTWIWKDWLQASNHVIIWDNWW